MRAERFTQPAAELVEVLGHDLAVIDMGSGRPTIFLHGGGPGCSGWTDFGAIAPDLAADRRVIIVDLLQYGGSSKIITDEPFHRWQAEHVVALMRAKGITAADFVCGSVGGAIGLHIALDHPDLVGRLVISGSTPTMHGWERPDVPGADQVLVAFNDYYDGDGPTEQKMRRLLELMEWYEASAIPDELVELRLRQSLAPELVAAGSGLTNTWVNEDLRERLHQVQSPTLFVYGRHDVFATPGYVQSLADSVQDGSVHIMGGTGHHLAEERPTAFAALVRAFFSE
jgi:pimeloyl-ACP methyl ester carboxylesterase